MLAQKWKSGGSAAAAPEAPKAGQIRTFKITALDAAAHDLPAAMTVWKGDEEVDAICTSLFRELLTYMMEDPRNISFCIHLMFCAKNIERIGDHATNIAETVFYMIEGQQILDKRPKGDMTTFATTVPGN